MSPLRFLLASLGDRLDEDLLPAVYAAASVPTAEVRAWLRTEGMAFMDAETGEFPSEIELTESAARVVAHTRDRATAMGFASGLMGAAAIPPEVLGTVIQSLRLAQRLAVVYGFDPESEAGKLVMWRALAAAWEIELPAQGPIGLKMRELPALLQSQLPATRSASAWLTQQVVMRASAAVVNRVTRVIPGLGAGLAGFSALRRTRKMGDRMIEVYRRAKGATPFEIEGEELAVEVG